MRINLEKKYLLKHNHKISQRLLFLETGPNVFFVTVSGCGHGGGANASLFQSSPIRDVDIFYEEEVEDFIGEGEGILGRALHFWEKKILTKKHLKTKKVSKEDRLNIPCSLTLHRTGAERHF